MGTAQAQAAAGTAELMRRHRAWIEASLLALGAGFAAVQLQPSAAGWRTQLFAFLAAALPVLAIHARHGAAAPEVKP